MQVSDLLRAGLGVRLVLGDADGLTRPVTGTSTVDLAHPGRYVGVGHLVLTGLVWRTSTADSDAFVAEAAAAGAAVLGVGEGLLGSVPDDVVAAAARHGLPLLAVPADVAFHTVAGHVTTTLGAGRGGAARLLEGLAAGRGLEALLGDLARDLHREVRVLSTTGNAVVPGARALDPGDVATVVAAGAGSPTGCTVALRGGPAHVRGAGSDEPLACWWLVVEGDDGDLRQDDLLDAAAGVVAVARRWHRDGAPAPTGGSVVAVSAALLPPAVPDVVAGLLADVLGVVAAVDPVTGVAVAVLGDDGTDVAGRLQERLRRLAPALSGRRLAVGVSRRGPDAGAAVVGAHRARAGVAPGAGVVVVQDAEPRSTADLLRSVPADVRREFVTEVLGPLTDDEDLVRTLRVYLTSGSSPTRAAAALHVHQNTVRYRIGRVEALLHRDLRDVEDLVDLHVALTLAAEPDLRDGR